MSNMVLLVLSYLVSFAHVGHLTPCPHDSCQANNCVRADSITPTVRSWRLAPAINLDFRNSFLERQHVNVWGINAGIEFGAKRHQLTLGYYWLTYATYLRLINWRRDAARRINLSYYTRTDLWFMSLLYWRNLTNNRRWMFSVPVEVGGGIAYAMPHNLRQDIQIDRTHRDFFVPVQAGAYGQWKATRWIGFSGQVGYRYSLFQTAINQHFNGVYYSVGMTTYPALFSDVWRMVARKDRISPFHAPRPGRHSSSSALAGSIAGKMAGTLSSDPLLPQ